MVDEQQHPEHARLSKRRVDDGVPCAPWTGRRSVGLPVGTRVWNRATGSAARFGTVMPHEPQYSHGRFPVRFDDQLWAVLDVSDVTAVSPEREAAIRSARKRAATSRKATI